LSFGFSPPMWPDSALDRPRRVASTPRLPRKAVRRGSRPPDAIAVADPLGRCVRSQDETQARDSRGIRDRTSDRHRMDGNSRSHFDGRSPSDLGLPVRVEQLVPAASAL